MLHLDSRLVPIRSWSFPTQTLSLPDNTMHIPRLTRDKTLSDMRLYTDILFRKFKMYSNYDPGVCLKLGDYGDITKQGEFIKSGNVFEDNASLENTLRPGKENIAHDRHYFASRSRKRDIVSIVTTELPELEGCSPKLAWDIKKDRHAALVMIDAIRCEIEFEGRLLKFLQEHPELAEKAVVTKLYLCSAYAQLITEYGQFGQVYAGFKGSNSTPGSTPIESASDVDTGGGPSWLTSTRPAWHIGKHCSSHRPYTPLVTLRQITPKEPANGYRDALPPEITDEQQMDDYIPPWGELDEQGDEIDG